MPATPPTVITGMAASLLMRSANGTWYMRPYCGFDSGELPALDTSSTSTPASFSQRATCTASSSVKPFCSSSIQSVAEMRTNRALSAGHTARTARATSSG